MTDDDADGAPAAGGGPPGDDGTDPEGVLRARPTLSTDGAYALLWGAVALVAAGLAFEGSVGPVAGLAGIAGGVGIYAAARDLLRGRPPSSLEYLWMGTPALLGGGIAALDGRFLVAGGLGVVAMATLVEGYGWFGAGSDATDDENAGETGDGIDEGDAGDAVDVADGTDDGEAGSEREDVE